MAYEAKQEPQALDIQSYADGIKAKLASEEVDGEKGTEGSEESVQEEQVDVQEEKGEQAEVEGDGSEEESEPDPAKDEEEQKIKAAREKIRLERERKEKAKGLESKAAEFDKVAPFIRSLVENKLDTLDKIISDSELNALLDRRIGKMSGKKDEDSKGNPELEALRREMKELRDSLGSQSKERERLTFSSSVAIEAPKHPDYDLANEYCQEKGYDLIAACTEFAEAERSAGRGYPTERAAINAIVDFIKSDLEISDRIYSKRKQKKEEPEEKEKQTKRTVKTSSVRHKTEDEPKITDRESYAMAIKRRLGVSG